MKPAVNDDAPNEFHHFFYMHTQIGIHRQWIRRKTWRLWVIGWKNDAKRNFLMSGLRLRLIAKFCGPEVFPTSMKFAKDWSSL
nr:hypothetical protein [Tanacetum cinerariifolium]